MSVDLELAPKQKRLPGVRCCEPVVYPDVEREHAIRIAAVARALGDPTWTTPHAPTCANGPDASPVR